MAAIIKADEFFGQDKGFTQEVTATPVRKEHVVTVPCIKCSKPIQPGMRFCPECGAAQAEPAQTEVSQANITPS